ncbi:hypothetical protein HU200_013815 [Digitaria exilis]|uniref:Uncharacterized protein n=1 Tax=Digitaria exilis TaxID=1010633 RepID=A0A835FCK7_9POAL|nr:hypothetical protein HU200_013815 [Digitaria exilis]
MRRPGSMTERTNFFIGLSPEHVNVNLYCNVHMQVATTQSKQTFIEGESHGTYSSEGSLDMVKQILEPEKNIFAGFPMDMKSLGEEYKALQGDKAGEIEYFHSLEETIIGMKGVSKPVRCRCGLEYKVELAGEAMDLS